MSITRQYADPRIIDDNTPAAAREKVATARAVAYAIDSSSAHLSKPARDTLSGIAHRVGRLLAAPADAHGAAEHWRVIAAVALQMEARAMGFDYTSCMNDKPLTPD